MKVFLAGVMQGNGAGRKSHNQNYRQELERIVLSIVQSAQIVDPDYTDPLWHTYSKKQLSEMFFKYCTLAGNVDLLIAYLPEASMGSACEMWNAYVNKVPIVTISPLIENATIRLLSPSVFTSLQEFKHSFNQNYLDEIGL